MHGQPLVKYALFCDLASWHCQHSSLNQPCALNALTNIEKLNPMPQNQVPRHLRRYLPHLPFLPKATNTKTSPSMTGWQSSHSLTTIPASHKQVYAIISTPWLMVPLSSTKQLSHRSSSSEKTLKFMQPHFRMRHQPNVSALSHALMSIRPCISGSSPWKPKGKLWLVACCARSEGFLSKSLEFRRRFGCKE